MYLEAVCLDITIHSLAVHSSAASMGWKPLAFASLLIVFILSVKGDPPADTFLNSFGEFALKITLFTVYFIYIIINRCAARRANYYQKSTSCFAIDLNNHFCERFRFNFQTFDFSYKTDKCFKTPQKFI